MRRGIIIALSALVAAGALAAFRIGYQDRMAGPALASAEARWRQEIGPLDLESYRSPQNANEDSVAKCVQRAIAALELSPAQREALAIAVGCRDLAGGRWLDQVDEEAFGQLAARFQGLLQLSRLLALEAEAARQEGDAQRAAETIGTLTRIGHSLRSEPFALTSLFAGTFDREALLAMRSRLSDPACDRGCAAVLGRLAGANAAYTYPNPLIGEALWGHLAGAAQLARERRALGPIASLRTRFLGLQTARVQAELLERWIDHILASQLAAEHRANRALAIQKRSALTPAARIADIAIPNLLAAVGKAERVTVAYRLATLAAATKSHARADGYPSLETVEASLPPWSGAEIKEQRADDGSIRLYAPGILAWIEEQDLPRRADRDPALYDWHLGPKPATDGT